MRVSSTTYYVIVNGVPTESIKPTRRIRHGDPISPYLFLLRVEALSSILLREET
jgi:hypothetical protein